MKRHSPDKKRQHKQPSRCLGCALLLLSSLLAGCKSREGSLGRGSDPLVYGPDRIPRQNVPLPERGSIGQTRPDPLIGAPTGRTPTRDTSGGYTDDPARFRGLHTPGPATTPAGLAGRRDDEEGLKITELPPERVPLRPSGESAAPSASGTPAAAPPQPDSLPTAGPALETLYQELDRLGVPPDLRSLHREDGQYVFRAILPWDGARRQYTGLGPTPVQAVRQILEQIRLDRGLQ
ncbi:MAG: hypothetical protein NZ703_06950 [Gemmataceae bacterium]|nr:hypothetical protein [Gemmataceae bacterium]